MPALMRTLSAEHLLAHMEDGRAYRREELGLLSGAVDRDLKRLVREGKVTRAAPGLYYRTRVSRWGALPISSSELVRAFLRSEDFLLTSLDVFNGLGVGLTQLSNEFVVYNRKRIGKFKLDGHVYHFKRPHNFPRKEQVNNEYLLVDLLNNYEDLPEPPDGLWNSLRSCVREMSPTYLEQTARQYGKVSTNKKLKELLADEEKAAAT